MRTLVAVLAVLTTAGPAFAQVKYVDEAGSTHYAQSESMVPERYRTKAQPLGPLPSVSVRGSMQGGSYGGLSSSRGHSAPSRLDLEDAKNERNMKDAADRNLAQKQADEAKKAENNRCVGNKHRSSPCF